MLDRTQKIVRNKQCTNRVIYISSLYDEASRFRETCITSRTRQTNGLHRFHLTTPTHRCVSCFSRREAREVARSTAGCYRGIRKRRSRDVSGTGLSGARACSWHGGRWLPGESDVAFRSWRHRAGEWILGQCHRVAKPSRYHPPGVRGSIAQRSRRLAQARAWTCGRRTLFGIYATRDLAARHPWIASQARAVRRDARGTSDTSSSAGQAQSCIGLPCAANATRIRGLDGNEWKGADFPGREVACARETYPSRGTKHGSHRQ